MHPAFTRIDHRPWPVPETPWTWRQNWHDLLFAHWPISTRQIRSLVPAELEIQEYDGTSWVGFVPFRMTGVMRRPFPDMPGMSAFPELNLRLYVTYEGKPGVWFLSLDASNGLAVWAARTFFHLPYFHAKMSLEAENESVHFRSERLRVTPAVNFQASYRPTSATYSSTPGTLEHFLTERYCLYARSPRGSLYRCEIHHLPWPLQRAEAEIERNDLGVPFGIHVSGVPALLHFSRRIDVVVWNPEKLKTSAPR